MYKFKVYKCQSRGGKGHSAVGDNTHVMGDLHIKVVILHNKSLSKEVLMIAKSIGLKAVGFLVRSIIGQYFGKSMHKSPSILPVKFAIKR